MTTQDLFIAAFALVANPATWTKHKSARDSAETPTRPLSDDAVCFCSAGAIERAGGQRAYASKEAKEIGEALNKSALELYKFGSYITINDLYQHGSVVAMWQHAGEREKWIERLT